ncbi:hypothetical protein [Nocardioides sp. GCM10030258]|uniref:hypothetical protein n=1 Tax=unclassified Nocardioides TaxID=2615069 RepID=UPI003613CEBA
MTTTANTPLPDNCGHARHHDSNYHYDQGRNYADFLIAAAHAATDNNDPVAARRFAHIADQVLWQHDETCASDLRDFIAGLANAADNYLHEKGVALTHL